MKVPSNLIRHQRFAVNTLGRDLFVGDIHGNYQLLMSALATLEFDLYRDRLFCCGDLIDRGPDSPACLALAAEPWCYTVLGNHEQFLLNYDADNVHLCVSWYVNGGLWWLALRALEQARLQQLVCQHYCLSLEICTEHHRIGVVHAEVPGLSWPPLFREEGGRDEDSLTALLWQRGRIGAGEAVHISGIDFVVCGHTPVPRATLLGNQLFLDTGCGYLPSLRLMEPRLSIAEFGRDEVVIHGFSGSYTSQEKLLFVSGTN